MTENLFGDMATKRDDGFDEWDPKNISQLVTFSPPTRPPT